MPGKTLVVRGGTLIDGTGRKPVENSVIFIEAGKFKAVGKSGEVQVPSDAEVIDVTGKTVIPGLVDVARVSSYTGRATATSSTGRTAPSSTHGPSTRPSPFSTAHRTSFQSRSRRVWTSATALPRITRRESSR